MKCSKSFWVTLCGILCVTFLAFSPSLSHQFFHVDDQEHLLENHAVRALDFFHLKDMFTSTETGTYIPLTYLSYALEYKFFQYQPFIYHLNNLLLHLAVTALVFVLALRLGLAFWAAAFAALLFGVHPLRVESVAWITERKDVLYAFFYLLSTYFYLIYIQAQPAQNIQCHRGRKIAFYLASLVMGLLSILSKPMALSLPLTLVVCDWLLKRRFTPRIIWEKIPYFLYVFPIAWVTYALHARVLGKNLHEGVLICLWSLTFNFKKFFWPAEIYPSYSIPQPVSIAEPAYAGAVVVFIVLAVSLYVLRKDRLFIFAFLYFFVSYFFLLRYDDLVVYAHPVADRFMYLPSMGLCFWIGALLIKGVARSPRAGKAAILAGMLVVISLLGFKTFRQSQLWGREIDLWTYVLQHEPDSFFARNSRGNLYLGQNKHRLAIVDLSQCIQLRPDYVPAYINRGLAYFDTGQTELALKDFDNALKHKNPNPDYVLINRSLVFSRLKLWDLALKDLNQAIAANPRSAYAYSNRGKVHLDQDRLDLAIRDFSKALQLRKDLGKTYVLRGDAYLKSESWDLALSDYQTALQYDPDNARAIYNRSFIYYKKGNYPQALQDALKAKSLGFSIREDYIDYLQGQK